MFKLMVVAGPNRGTSYAVQEGETSIGRQVGNVIVLESAKVSKRHCKLVVSDGKVLLSDEGSVNGTFVNGVLAKNQLVSPGDKIGVGEFVFELRKRSRKNKAPAIGGELAEIVHLPELRSERVSPASRGLSVQGAFSAGLPASGAADALGGLGGANSFGEFKADAVPTDLKGKAIWFFEHRVMPFFYELNFRHQWRAIAMGLFGGLVLLSVLLSLYPVFNSSRETAIRELAKRAQLIARQIAERNNAAIAQEAESKTEIGSLDREDGVRLAVLADLDGRVIAPANRLNKVLAAGPEATVAHKAADLFKRGRETGVVTEADSSTVVAVEPVKVFSSQSGRNIISAMAVVSMDSSLSTPNVGQMGLAYAQTIILLGVLGGFVLMVLYRLTLRPFLVLNDDLDRALKGEVRQVTHEFKLEELNPLWDVINSTLQRVSTQDDPYGMSQFGQGTNPQALAEEYVGPLRKMAEVARAGLLVLDAERKVVFLDSKFEEISGIRAESAVGQGVELVARDQAFIALCNDLFERAAPGADGASEEFEFSGESYTVHAMAFGAPGVPARCLAMWVTENG